MTCECRSNGRACAARVSMDRMSALGLLDQLEAERLILTAELGNALCRRDDVLNNRVSGGGRRRLMRRIIVHGDNFGRKMRKIRSLQMIAHAGSRAIGIDVGRPAPPERRRRFESFENRC